MKKGNYKILIRNLRKMNSIIQLIEDYKRRIKTANEMLKESKEEEKIKRLETKISAYMRFVVELKRVQKQLINQ